MRQVDEHEAKSILEYNNFGKSMVGQILQLTLQITHIFLIIICLPTINILTCIKMNKFLDLKKKITAKSCKPIEKYE